MEATIPLPLRILPRERVRILPAQEVIRTDEILI
jgi:hypothetical protein